MKEINYHGRIFVSLSSNSKTVCCNSCKKTVGRGEYQSHHCNPGQIDNIHLQRFLTLWTDAYHDYEELRDRRERKHTFFKGTRASHQLVYDTVINEILSNLEWIDNLDELYHNYAMVSGDRLFPILWGYLKQNGPMWAMNLHNTEDVAYYLKYTEVVSNN